MDYFAIRCAWKHLVLESFNSADLDSGNATVDHLPAFLSIKGPLKTKIDLCKSNNDGVDWWALRRCRDDDVWHRVFSALPSFPVPGLLTPISTGILRIKH